jgi:hypothetical protein
MGELEQGLSVTLELLSRNTDTEPQILQGPNSVS